MGRARLKYPSGSGKQFTNPTAFEASTREGSGSPLETTGSVLVTAWPFSSVSTVRISSYSKL
ncbi:MAG: hypothetical protein A2902_02515 [Elusimicrobia bacterium RIFCSPLOWO2_01_FULL_64_13]|nr:MAG: hypothetical protein A2902_02515 [Elusimicrobia bacterium RIFCSPLOWO2_01_FULL_64_13]